MEIIAYAAIAYLLVRLLVALANLFTRPYLKPAQPKVFPFISILIPARNEEQNIGALLDELINLDYPHFEIFVYDDDSADRTAELIEDRCRRDSRIKYIKGNGPSEGWLGKNFACDQMARQANGEYNLFIDADVRVKPGLLNDSLATMQKYNLHLLSVFPVQIMKSLGEWFTVPLMNRILVGNLPLILVQRSRLVDFAAANGQLMMFRTETYRKHWFHQQFRGEKVEDVQIIRMMKKQNYRVSTLLSAGQVSCRMYNSYKEGLAGFSKNIHAFFGNNWLILFVYNLLTTIGLISVWIAISFQAMLIYLAGLIAFSVLVSIQSRQSVWKNIVLMPFQQFSVVLISLLSTYRHMTNRFVWKDRKI